MSGGETHAGCVLCDWGDTPMRDFPEFTGPMVEWPRVEVCAHAAEALAALRARGWLLALATSAADSAERHIWAALHRGGLDRVYCFRTVGSRKPSRAFFECIVRDLDLPRAAIVMVGDDFAADVLGANAAGLRAVWVAGEGEAERTGATHRTIHDLSELPALLEQWNGTGADRTRASS